MDIGEIVNDAIRYPSSDWKKVIILGLLFLISFLIIPIFLATGYGFRALKASIAGFDELLNSMNGRCLLMDSGIGLQIVYMIVPMMIIIIAGVFGSLSMVSPDTGMITNPTAFTGLLGGTVIIGVIPAIILGLIETIAIAHMAYNDSELGAAFRFGEILDVISQIGWVDYIMVHRCRDNSRCHRIRWKLYQRHPGYRCNHSGPHNNSVHCTVLEPGPCTPIRLRIITPNFLIFSKNIYKEQTPSI